MPPKLKAGAEYLKEAGGSPEPTEVLAKFLLFSWEDDFLLKNSFDEFNMCCKLHL